MDDKITADHIYDTYRRYPGYKSIVKLDVEAVWSNWLNEESIPLDRLIECKDAMEDAINYGWSIIIVDATTNPPSCERWHPKIQGVGCEIINTSRKGFPIEAQIQAKFPESDAPLNYRVGHYPCEVKLIKIGELEDGTPITSNEYIRDKPEKGGIGFFLLRTRGGKKGIAGLPKFLDLLMITRKAFDIIENYAVYAENQALATTAVGLERNNEQNRTSVKAQFTSQITHRKLLIVGKEDWVDWVSPMNSAWDPWAMLEYIDKLIARDTQMNKLMLEGDPSGYLSASETAINNWESKTKERQAYWLGQFKPIFKALGATDDVQFKDPSKPTFISLMEGLKACREAMIDIVQNEDIVNLFNEYLNKHGYEEMLTPISNEEMKDNQMGDMNDKDDQSGNKSPGQREGSDQASREK